MRYVFVTLVEVNLTTMIPSPPGKTPHMMVACVRNNTHNGNKPGHKDPLPPIRSTSTTTEASPSTSRPNGADAKPRLGVIIPPMPMNDAQPANESELIQLSSILPCLYLAAFLCD